MSLVVRAFNRDLTTFVSNITEVTRPYYQSSEVDEGAAVLVIPQDTLPDPAVVADGALLKIRIGSTDVLGYIVDRRYRSRRDSYDTIQLICSGLLSVTGRAVTFPAGGMDGPPNDYRLFAWNGLDYLMRASWTTPPDSLGQYRNPTDSSLAPDPGDPAINEVQRVRLGAEIPPPPFPWGTSTYPSSSLTGTWTLNYDGRRTAPIQWNVVTSASSGRNEIKAALEALSNVDGVTVTGSDPWDVEFDTGNVAGRSLSLMSMDHTDLRHTHYSWHVRRETTGSAAVEGEEIIEGWPDPRAEWFGGFGKIRYFRRVLDVTAKPEAAGTVRMFVAGLDDFEVWFDGQSLGSGGAYQMARWDIDLLETKHVWGIRSEGPVIGTIVRMDGDEVGNVLYRTFTPAVFGGSGAPDPWYQHGPDDPHGVTPGFMLGTLFDEAKDRGVLAPLSRTFTNTLDSAGREWPDDVELGLLVGNDTLLNVLGRLSDLDITGDVDPDLDFHVWSGHRVDRTATARLELDEVYELSAETDDKRVEALLVRWELGWLYRHEPSGGLLHEDFLSIGTVPSERAAFELAGKEIEALSSPRLVLSWVTNESTTTLVPTIDYAVGDLIEGPSVTNAIAADWFVGTVRITTLQARPMDNGEIEWVHQAVIE